MGSTAREIGVLVLVFAPLESYLRGPDTPAAFVVLAAIGSLLLMAAGIILEARADKKR